MKQKLLDELMKVSDLIPRYKGDQVGITWHPGELSDADKEEILLKVKEQLS